MKRGSLQKVSSLEMAVFRNSLLLRQHHIDPKFLTLRSICFLSLSPLIKGKGIVSEEFPLVISRPPPCPSLFSKDCKKNHAVY